MMRAAWMIAIALCGFGPFHGRLVAETPKRTAVVDLNGVELRAGPSMSSAPVGILSRGESVIVLREEDSGFYAILPPKGYLSWVKAIHLGKVNFNETGRANAPVVVPFAPVMAGTEKTGGPTIHKSTTLPEGSIVEVVGPSVRIDNANWYPIVPPEGDARWLPKSAIKTALAAIPSAPVYVRPDPPAYTVGSGEGGKVGGDVPVRPAVAGLPKALSDHRLWAEASQEERLGNFSQAETLYAKIYSELWDAKADREALVICYNRAIRCQEMRKNGNTRPAARTEASSPPRGDTVSRPAEKPAPTPGTWTDPGYLREMQKVFVDGLQAFALEDEKGNVLLYVTSTAGIELRNFTGKKVQLFGTRQTRADLYRPYLVVEKIEPAR
jgi:hypothetical protein